MLRSFDAGQIKPGHIRAISPAGVEPGQKREGQRVEILETAADDRSTVLLEANGEDLRDQTAVGSLAAKIVRVKRPVPVEPCHPTRIVQQQCRQNDLPVRLQNHPIQEIVVASLGRRQ